MDDVLFDRHVNFIDEVAEIDIIQVIGGQTRWQILRKRKAAAASRTTTTTATGWRKEPVTFSLDRGDYRRLLDGVDPILPEPLAPAPAMNSLALRVSWPPGGHCAATGFIASSHENILALCVGNCYDTLAKSASGCYLVLDTRAKSVPVVPPLHAAGRSLALLPPIGSAGVAVLRTDDGGFLLAELCRHNDQDDFPANTATLFTWRSPASGSGGGPRGAGADQWVGKEVVLPLPVPGPDEDDDPYWFFSFSPGTVFAVSNTSLCWVDVWAGILVCNNISRSSTHAAADDGSADDDDGLVFTFIPLPEGCACGPQPCDSTEFRSVCCVDSETIRLLCMDDGGEEVTAAVTTWTLRFPLSTDGGWRWEKDEDASCSSLCVADLLDDAIPPVGGGGGDKRRLLRRVVSWPVVSSRAWRGVAHVCVHDLKFKRKEKAWVVTGSYEVSLDVPRRRVVSVFTFPAGSLSDGRMVMATTLATRDGGESNT